MITDSTYQIAFMGMMFSENGERGNLHAGVTEGLKAA
jgi:hypothetical protein